ncbi:hypothetical protein ABPG72_012548 [Tetrahymena utriculariae]
MDKGGCGDQKSILIVLHGDLKINNQKNLSGGHQNNASTGNSNIGVEEKTNEELQQQQHQLQLQTLTPKSTITSSQLSELCWEVFDLQNKKSLTGVQSLKQEDFNLQSIQSYIQDISQDSSILISFLISDSELYSVLQGMSNLDWIYKYEIFDILHQAELIFSDKKDSIKELIDYFSFQKDQQTAYKSETFQTASLISKTVSIMLRTTIPFKYPLNQEILKLKNQTFTNKTENKESQKNILQSPQLKIIRQLSENSNQRQIVDKEELRDQQGQINNESSHYYLKLRGIPYNAKEPEIQDFLGLTLEKYQIVLKYDKDEKFTGECFIKAKDQAQSDKIKSMHKKTMKKRYIEIFVADKSEFISAQESQNMNDSNFFLTEKGVSSNFGHGLGQLISSSSKNQSDYQNRDRRKDSKRERSRTRSSRSRDKASKSSSKRSNSFSSASSSCSSSSQSSHIRNQDSQSDSKYSKSGSRSDSYLYLRLRGLPFNAREAEIQQFLGISLDQDQITFKHDNDGRFSGECVIRTKDQNQIERIKNMHMKNMGKRYIEVFVAEKSDFVRAQDSQFIDDQKSGISQINSQIDPNLLQSACIVKIRGLPYNATDQDIQKFFKDSQIVQNGIQKVYDGKRPSGEAFIIFATKLDAQKAIERDKEKMGTRYIEIFLSHLKEFTNHIKKRKSHSGGLSNSNGGSSSSSTSNKFLNHGNNGNRYDKYSNNQGGFSNHNNHGRNNSNEGRFNNHHSRYSNSPHRNYGKNGNNHNSSQNGSGFYKKGMGSVNGNYDRNTKEFQENQNQSKFHSNDEKFTSVNNSNNNSKGYTNSYNNNQNQMHNNNANSNHNYGSRNNNNYQNDFNSRHFKNKGKDDQGKYSGNNHFGNKQHENNQFNQSQQHNQYQNHTYPNQNQQQQPYNKNKGAHQTQNDGGYYGGNYDYQYQNQQQSNSQQINQQQSSSSSGYPQENNQINKNYNNNQNDIQQYSHHHQHNQQLNYFNNSNSGQYQQQQQYQNQQYNQNNPYDLQYQPINYSQYSNQNNHNQQNYPPNNYYSQNQQDHHQQQQNQVNTGQQGHPSLNTNVSHNSQQQYYQQNMFDVQHQQHRYY